jgi:hypothetical protein
MTAIERQKFLAAFPERLFAWQCRFTTHSTDDIQVVLEFANSLDSLKAVKIAHLLYVHQIKSGHPKDGVPKTDVPTSINADTGGKIKLAHEDS